MYTFTSCYCSSNNEAIPCGSLKADWLVVPSFKLKVGLSAPPSHEKTSFLKGSKTFTL